MTSRGERTSRRPHLLQAQVQVQCALTTKEAAIPTRYGSPPQPGQARVNSPQSSAHTTRQGGDED